MKLSHLGPMFRDDRPGGGEAEGEGEEAEVEHAGAEAHCRQAGLR